MSFIFPYNESQWDPKLFWIHIDFDKLRPFSSISSKIRICLKNVYQNIPQIIICSCLFIIKGSWHTYKDESIGYHSSPAVLCPSFKRYSLYHYVFKVWCFQTDPTAACSNIYYSNNSNTLCLNKLLIFNSL